MIENKNKRWKEIFLIWIVLIIAIAGFVLAQSQEDLEAELNILISELTNSGYDWLVDYSGELPAVEPAEIEVYTEDDDTLITKFEDII